MTGNGEERPSEEEKEERIEHAEQGAGPEPAVASSNQDVSKDDIDTRRLTVNE